MSLLAALCLLASVAPVEPSEDGPPPAVEPEPEPILIEDHVEVRAVTLSARVSGRAVAEEFLVLPQGLQLQSSLRLLTADDRLGLGRLRITDVALFDVATAWAFARHFELDASLTLLPKQPSATSEPVFQGGSLGVRRDLVRRTAVALVGSARPLLGIDGLALGGALFVAHRHRLNEIVTFDVAGGVNATFVRPDDGPRARLIEGAAHATVLVRCPNRMCGGWLGAGYALPAYQHGLDPVSIMPLDSQPRLDLELGAAVQLADRWDLSAELSIIDRGDLAAPATHLPILDGGFDQVQLTIGLGRRFDLGDSRSRGISDPMIQL